MRYELYVDSLFFLNFIMNLYLLLLVDRGTLRTASPGRLAAGAAAGAFCFLLPFLGIGPAGFRLGAGILAGTAGMLCITFPVRNLRMFLKLLERLVIYSFGMGGGMLFLIRVLPGYREFITSLPGLLCMGGLFFLLFRRFKYGLDTEEVLCRAVLLQGEKKLEVNALLDSGNSLTEPVSGKPVCIVGKEVFRGLQEGGSRGFRAIPYHSIGKNHGILPGYLLEELRLEAGGMKMSFNDVYIAVSDEEISCAKSSGAEDESVKMIINPRLFAEGKKGRPRRRQNERRNDSESNHTGQNANQNDPQGQTAPAQEGGDPLHRGSRGAASSAGAGTGESGDQRSGDRI